MAWKDLQTWLRAGIILASISLLDGLIILIFGDTNLPILNQILMFAFLLSFLILIPASLIIKLLNIPIRYIALPGEGLFISLNLIGILLNTFLWFGIGALIGWIIGKIKSKK